MWLPGASTCSLVLSVAVLIICYVSSVWSIMVPTGKLTPISPAVPLNPGESKFSTPIRRSSLSAAPVYEYTNELPEPAPLDPRFVPQTYKFIQYLRKNSINYVPTHMKMPKYQQKYYEKYAKYPAHLRQKYYEYDRKQSQIV